MRQINLLILSSYILVINNVSQAQLWDNYDGIGGLTYTSEDATYWVVNAGEYEAQTGGVSSPEHSYSSYDMTESIVGWSLSNSNQNEWIGWMDLNRSSVSGWGGSNYCCGLVLSANSSDLNDVSTSGYAIGFRDGGVPADELVLFRFSAGITSGTTSLPGTSTEILSSGYSYSEADNGINFYVKLENDGKWTIKYKAGAQLSDANAIDPANYSDGSVTSSIADETYRGTDYKYAGWIYAHNTSANEEAHFDNFGFAQNGSMPVELSSFSAVIINEGIKINWRTETEVNNYGFEVERRIENQREVFGNWEMIGFVNGHGNSNSPKDYFFIDNNVFNGYYSYRLKQIDTDGSFTYSKIIEIDLGIPLEYNLSQNYPNPFNPVTTIMFSLPRSGNVKLYVYNNLGELIMKLVDGLKEAGIHTVNLNAENLTSGIYFYTLDVGEFSDVRKMNFVK